jgi:hypothetical protein
VGGAHRIWPHCATGDRTCTRDGDAVPSYASAFQTIPSKRNVRWDGVNSHLRPGIEADIPPVPNRPFHSLDAAAGSRCIYSAARTGCGSRFDTSPCQKPSKRCAHPQESKTACRGHCEHGKETLGQLLTGSRVRPTGSDIQGSALAWPSCLG